MEAHGEDLRRTGVPEELVRALKLDWRTAPLDSIDVAICLYAEKLTLTPASMVSADVEALQTAGLDDRAIHDVCAVTVYFAYINRIADGLGVELEPEMKLRGIS